MAREGAPSDEIGGDARLIGIISRDKPGTFIRRRGVAQSWAVKFYHSRGWRTVQASYMRREAPVGGGLCPPYMCERCFERGRLVPAEIVHHKVWLTPENITDPTVTLSYGNLMRVCRDCHAAIHSGEGDFRQRVGFDENGRVVRLGTEEEGR